MILAIPGLGRMCSMTFARAVLWLAPGIFLVTPFLAVGSDITFARDTLEIVTRDNRTYAFEVDLAVTPAQRAHGLMFRQDMTEGEGMLFLFDREAPRSFWMKNTYLALDIIFLDQHGVIARITPDAMPFDETSIPSIVPAAGVLEVLAGTARRLGLGPGDRVFHRAFDAPPEEETGP